MYRGIKLFCTVLLTLLLLGCGMDGGMNEEFNIPESSSKRPTLVLGRVPSETIIQLLKENEPLINILEKRLNMDIQFQFAKNYQLIIEGMKDQRYDLAVLGPLAYVRSQLGDTPAAYTPIVRPERTYGDHYRGIIFTHRKSGIEELSDLEAKSFAYVDRFSASGHLFPKAAMIEAGLSPDGTFFSDTSFLGRHDRVVRAVYRREFSAGAAYNDARPAALGESANPDEVLPIIDKTRKIPTSPIVASNNFRKNHPEKLKEFIHTMINLHKKDQIEGGENALESLGSITRYIKAQEDEYEEVRKVINLVEQRNGE